MSSTESTPQVPFRPKSIPLGVLQEIYRQALSDQSIKPFVLVGPIPGVNTDSDRGPGKIASWCQVLQVHNLDVTIRDVQAYLGEKGNIQAEGEIQKIAEIVLSALVRSVYSQKIGFESVELFIKLMEKIAPFYVRSPTSTEKPVVMGVHFVRALHRYLKTNLGYETISELSKLKIDRKNLEASEKYYRSIETVTNAAYAAYYLYTRRGQKYCIALKTENLVGVLEMVIDGLNRSFEERERFNQEMKDLYENDPSSYRDYVHIEGLEGFDNQIRFGVSVLNLLFLHSREELLKDDTPIRMKYKKDPEEAGVIGDFYRFYVDVIVPKIPERSLLRQTVDSLKLTTLANVSEYSDEDDDYYSD